LCDHFALCIQVYVHNLFIEDNLVSQLGKMDDTMGLLHSAYLQIKWG